MIAAVFVVSWVLCGGFAALIAIGRGREPGWFAVGGLLLGVFGLLITAFAAHGDDLEQQRLDEIADAKARHRH